MTYSKGVDLNLKEGVEELGGVEGQKTIIIIYMWVKNSILNKRKKICINFLPIIDLRCWPSCWQCCVHLKSLYDATLCLFYLLVASSFPELVTEQLQSLPPSWYCHLTFMCLYLCVWNLPTLSLSSSYNSRQLSSKPALLGSLELSCWYNSLSSERKGSMEELLLSDWLEILSAVDCFDGELMHEQPAHCW